MAPVPRMVCFPDQPDKEAFAMLQEDFPYRNDRLDLEGLRPAVTGPDAVSAAFSRQLPGDVRPPAPTAPHARNFSRRETDNFRACQVSDRSSGLQAICPGQF